MLYGSKSWRICFKREQGIRNLHIRYLRRNLVINWFDRISDAVVLTLSLLPTYTDFPNRRAYLRLFGHVHRMSDGRIPKVRLYGELTKVKKGKGAISSSLQIRLQKGHDV